LIEKRQCKSGSGADGSILQGICAPWASSAGPLRNLD
jgi:hypothetical protein